MKFSVIRIPVIAFSLMIGGAYAFSSARPELVPESVKAAFSSTPTLKSFEFLGCSGEWTDMKPRPQVWLAGRKNKFTFLVKHPADCGYTSGLEPRVKIMESAIELGYSMSNDDGVVASCTCEYWALFELDSVPDTLAKISLNGEDAQLMGGLGKLP